MRLNTLKSISSLKLARGHYDLIKLSHSGFSQDFYLINNTEGITYDSQDWQPFPFSIVLESRRDLQGASIAFVNITREIETQLEKALSSANEDIICEHTQITLERDGGNLVVGLVSDTRTLNLAGIKVTRESVFGGLPIRNSLIFGLSKYRFGNNNLFRNINI